MFYFVFYIILVYNLHYNIYCMGVDFLKEKTDNFSNENIIDDSEKKLSKKEKIALQEKMEMEEIRKAKKGFKRGVLVLLAFLFFILSLTSIPFKLIKSSPEKISKITVENMETKKFVEIEEKYKIEEFVNRINNVKYQKTSGTSYNELPKYTIKIYENNDVPKLIFYIIDEEHGAFENMYFHPKKGKIDIDVIKQYVN